MLENDKPPISIIMYICPNARTCGNYYAAPEFRPDKTPGLGEPQRRRMENGNDASFSRLDCPACRQRSIYVKRVPFIVTTIASLEDALVDVKAVPDVIYEATGHEATSHNEPRLPAGPL